MVCAAVVELQPSVTANSDAGEIHYDGQPVVKRTDELRRTIQMVYQDTTSSLSPRLTVIESVREPLGILKIGDASTRTAKAQATLTEVGLSADLWNSLPSQLSGGEVQRVVIARALVVDPMLLIADEPTSALDPSIQAKLMKLLNNLQENRGLAILFITHDLALARRVSDHIYKLS